MAVMAGNADLHFTAIPTVLRKCSRGKIKMLAQSDKHRLMNPADKPTVSESGLPGSRRAVCRGDC
jgi:tripartite-type tricarboxylate transporter receptor subunit TctC